MNSNWKAVVVGVGKAGESPFQKGGGHKIGYVHGEMYATHPRVELVAAADINAENLQAFQTKFAVPQGFADYDEMFDKVRPDIVSICTYVGLHRQIIESAVRHGVRSIFCEKPFVASPADLTAIEKLVEASGVQISMTHVRRYRPSYQKAKSLWRSGVVGAPLICLQGIQDWDISEMGAHTLDLIRFFHDDEPILWALAQFRVLDARGYGHAMEEHGIVTWEFQEGGRGLLDGGKKLNDDGEITLVGSQGTIRVNEEKLTLLSPQGHEVFEFGASYEDGRWESIWTAALDDILQWSNGGAPAQVGWPHTLGSAQLNLAAYLSAIEGDRIDFPFESELDEWPVEVLARRRLAEVT